MEQFQKEVDDGPGSSPHSIGAPMKYWHKQLKRSVSWHAKLTLALDTRKRKPLRATKSLAMKWQILFLHWRALPIRNI